MGVLRWFRRVLAGTPDWRRVTMLERRDAEVRGQATVAIERAKRELHADRVKALVEAYEQKDGALRGRQ